MSDEFWDCPGCVAMVDVENALCPDCFTPRPLGSATYSRSEARRVLWARHG